MMAQFKPLVLMAVVFIFAITTPLGEASNLKKLTGHLKVANLTGIRSNKPRISNLGYEVCDEICSWLSCTTYYCDGDDICCTPGSPDSLCCAEDHPVCLEEGCCIVGSTHVCGDLCCTSEEACGCTDVECCTNPDACCNSAESCCDDDSPACCSGDCCNALTMACCGDDGCAIPCPSQFEAVPCSNNLINTPTANVNERELKNVGTSCPSLGDNNAGTLYRVTRPGETCQGGLISKNPEADESISSHVGCGSRPNYESQFITFSTSYDVVYKKYWPHASSGARLVKVDVETQVPKDCKIYDLTKSEVRLEYLVHTPWAGIMTQNDCEVLLQCGTAHVSCHTKLGPKVDELEDATTHAARANSN